MNKNQQRQLFSDDEDVKNTDEGEGEISGSNGSGMEEPDDDEVRRTDARGQSIGIKDVKRSVGQVNNFAFNNGLGDASKNSKKPSVDLDAESNNMSFQSNPKAILAKAGPQSYAHSKKSSNNTES